MYQKTFFMLNLANQTLAIGEHTTQRYCTKRVHCLFIIGVNHIKLLMESYN